MFASVRLNISNNYSIVTIEVSKNSEYTYFHNLKLCQCAALFVEPLALDNSYCAYHLYIPTNVRDIVICNLSFNLNNLEDLKSKVLDLSHNLSTDNIVLFHLVSSCIKTYLEKNTEYVWNNNICW